MIRDKCKVNMDMGGFHVLLVIAFFIVDQLHAEGMCESNFSRGTKKELLVDVCALWCG
jgi:hypothetical protein